MRYDDTNFLEVREKLNTLETVLDMLKGSVDDKSFSAKLRRYQGIMVMCNTLLFDVANIDDYDDLFDSSLNEKRTNNEVLSRCEDYYNFIKNIYLERKELPLSIDRNFKKICDQSKYVSYDNLVKLVKERLLKKDENMLSNYKKFFDKFEHFWGKLDVKAENFEVITKRMEILKANIEDFISVYEELADNRSKAVLTGYLHNWLTMSEDDIFDMGERIFFDYADFDICKCDSNEIIADIGAYNGDSALGYIYSYGSYKKMYCYEITPSSFEKLSDNLKGYENIILCRKGVGSKYSETNLDIKDDAYSNDITSKGDLKTEIVTLDEDIKDKLTLIKMDIEGAEKDALKGCVNHIKNEKPKLLICVYHGNTDIFEIPKLIKEMRSDYKFYLRSSGWQYAPSEIVLYAL